MSLFVDNQAEINEALNSTSRYLADLLNITSKKWSAKFIHQDCS